MENRIPRKDLWDSAGKAGLVLGLVSSAYVVITYLLAKVFRLLQKEIEAFAAAEEA